MLEAPRHSVPLWPLGCLRPPLCLFMRVLQSALPSLLSRSLRTMTRTEGCSFGEFYSPCVSPCGWLKFYRDGQWHESSSGKAVGIINPSTNGLAFEVQGACVRSQLNASATMRPPGAGRCVCGAYLRSMVQRAGAWRCALWRARPPLAPAGGHRRRRALRGRVRPPTPPLCRHPCAACTQQEVDEVFASSKKAQKVRPGGGRCRSTVNGW